ncbi:MAG: hypothetical protein KBG84_00710 [Planctomycetes bacterium]|nr:hypothetical protein [Planctomycetota bacterium]
MDFGSGVPDLEPLVDRVFGSLQSSFLLMPRGKGFIEYPTFETGYESLKKATDGFSKWDPEKLLAAIVQTPIAHVVIRSMLGFSPPEWAHVAEQRWEIEIPQGYMRTLDRRIRLAALTPMKERALSDERLQALVKIACELLTKRAPEAQPGFIHRLDKADTRGGHVDIKALAQVGVPYAVLLYERFLGRPFASHRDSVSGHVGDAMETPIEDLLSKAQITFRKTKRAERVAGFDQAPDFIVPDEFSPAAVIEAKITEDDGTARDKVTRIQHLAELSEARVRKGGKAFEVIACIDGRGFGVRREDMRKILTATRGKVFTLKTLDQMLKHTGLSQFKSS